MNKILTRKRLFDLFIMTFGVMLVALSYSFFLQPNNIVIGGVSGVGVIYQYLSGIDPALLMLITNLLLLIIGLIFLGRSFFLKSIYGSLMFPVFVKIFNIVFDYLPNSFQNQITNIDLFLIVVFSSIIMGIGLGIVVKRGGTTGGTEIPQNILFKYFHISFSVSLLILDGAVILTGFLVLKSLSLALYSIIFTFICNFYLRSIFSSALDAPGLGHFGCGAGFRGCIAKRPVIGR
ncbi:MAG: YitT family protein, partial [Bacilli bacterium]|nr:YitT family protein [Bacilli bacterium]